MEDELLSLIVVQFVADVERNFRLMNVQGLVVLNKVQIRVK